MLGRVWSESASFQGLDIHFALEKCSQCGKPLQLSSAFLVNKLRTMMNDAIVKYSMVSPLSPIHRIGSRLQNLVVCEDVACAFRSRRASLQFTRDGVQCPRCHSGLLKREVSACPLVACSSHSQSTVLVQGAVRSAVLLQIHLRLPGRDPPMHDRTDQSVPSRLCVHVCVDLQSDCRPAMTGCISRNSMPTCLECAMSSSRRTRTTWSIWRFSSRR